MADEEHCLFKKRFVSSPFDLLHLHSKKNLFCNQYFVLMHISNPILLFIICNLVLWINSWRFIANGIRKNKPNYLKPSLIKFLFYGCLDRLLTGKQIQNTV